MCIKCLTVVDLGSSWEKCARKEVNVLFNNIIILFMYRKEGNVLFNDGVDTFYLLLYGIQHMVKNH